MMAAKIGIYFLGKYMPKRPNQSPWWSEFVRVIEDGLPKNALVPVYSGTPMDLSIAHQTPLDLMDPQPSLSLVMSQKSKMTKKSRHVAAQIYFYEELLKHGVYADWV